MEQIMTKRTRRKKKKKHFCVENQFQISDSTSYQKRRGVREMTMAKRLSLPAHVSETGNLWK